MKNKSVVSIGYRQYAFDSAAKAAKIFELMSGAVEVQRLCHADESGLWQELDVETVEIKKESFTMATSEQIKKAEANEKIWRKERAENH
tara:strand:- start:508 stop:774 length:267 start_codon:yes stop_codon:yes gene_type:complete